MTYNVKNSRVGALLAPATSVWFGTIDSYNTASFMATVTTISGNLTAVLPGFCLYTGALLRVKSVDAGAGTIQLAENEGGDMTGQGAAAYPVRLPFPRYQKLAGDGTIYKDFDIPFTTAQAEQPPQIIITPEVIYCGVREGVLLVADGTRVIYPGGGTVTLTWDAGTGGVASAGNTRDGVVNVDCGLIYSTPGFRYLTVTATDSNGVSATRYIPVWAGITPQEIQSARRRYQANEGWTADLEIYTPPVYLANSPVALVDLDTKAVIFYGWFNQANAVYDFEQQVLRVSAYSALAFARRLHSYPFVINSATAPASWNDLKTLTLPRALRFLLSWHSNLPELANIDAGDPDTRAIASQYFTAGSIADQARALGAAGFWDLISQESGGVSAAVSPLYDSATWVPDQTLVADEIAGNVTREIPELESSEVRLDGVYWNGSAYVPLIVRAPDHPARLGRPEEVTGLAPLSQSELLAWGSRHYAVKNHSEKIGFESLRNFDPGTVQIVAIPDGSELYVNEISTSFDKNALRWVQQLAGYTRGVDYVSVVVPPPPTPIYPPPDNPPVLPPLPPLPPDQTEWPGTVYAFTQQGGVYRCTDFPDADAGAGVQPTWNAVNAGLGSLEIRQGDYDPTADVAYCLTEDERTIYRLDGTGATWEEILTTAQARTLCGVGAYGVLAWVTFDRSTGYIYAYFSGGVYDVGQYVLKSSDDGATWAVKNVYAPGFIFQAGNLWVNGQNWWRSVQLLIGYSPDAGENWYYTAAMGFSAFAVWFKISNLDLTTAFCNGNGIGGPDLMRVVAPGMSATVLWDALDLGPNAPDGLTFLPTTWNTQRLLKASKIYETFDGWISMTTETPTALTPAMHQIYSPSDLQPAWLILGRADGVTALSPTTVYTCVGSGGTPVDRSGANAGSAPYLNSIPYTAGGLAYGGLGFKI